MIFCVTGWPNIFNKLWAITCNICWIKVGQSFSNLQKSTGQSPQSSKTNSPFSVFGVRECNQNYSSNAANRNKKIQTSFSFTICDFNEQSWINDYNHLQCTNTWKHSENQNVTFIRIKTSQSYQTMNLGKFFNSEFFAVPSLFAQAYIHSCSPKWVENISSPL